MKTNFYIFLFLLISATSYSQRNGEIKGKIFDEETKDPLFSANVWVEIAGSKFGTITDFEGRFTLKPLDAGVYDLNVSFTGKRKYFLDNVRVNSGKITFLKDIFIPDSTLLEFEVKADRYEGNERLIRPEDPTAMTILPADIKNNPLNKMPMTMIANSVPGIYQADHNQPLYFRGSRNDAVQYVVDGVKMRDGELKIPSCAIGEITVYTGGVPAMYGDVTGGIVVIETKSYFEIYNQKKGR